MRLRSLRVVGFEALADSKTLDFSPGINAIVGQNNVGKSSILKALRPGLPDIRYRSPTEYRRSFLPLPAAHLSIVAKGDEVTEQLALSGSTARWPIQPNSSPNAELLSPTRDINFRVVHNAGGTFIPSQYPAHSQFDELSEPAFTNIGFSNGTLSIAGRFFDNGDDGATIVGNLWSRKFFFFNAERFSVGSSQHHFVERLAPNASNLPAVLGTLSGTRGDDFQRIVGHMREIFGTVGNISIQPSETNPQESQIRVWPTESMRSIDLGFPLDSSGTGIAQTLAILTAVSTLESAVIAIDEIHSFLHPAAVKKLLRVIQSEYSKHQYIISTHSMEVLKYGNPSTVHLMKRAGYNTTIQSVSLGDVGALREVSDQLGVSMADVFSADHVIWVEGPTEEICFPLIAQRSRPVPKEISFVSVFATGDLTGGRRRERERIFQIYSRLTSAVSPLARSVGFSFDREVLSVADQERLIEESRGHISFLPARHIECFCISPDAILQILTEDDPQGVVRDRDRGRVAAELVVLGMSDKFKVIETWAGDISDKKWQRQVNAADLIDAAIGNLSDQRLRLDKVRHVPRMVAHMLDNNADDLQDLSDYVEVLIERHLAPTQ